MVAGVVWVLALSHIVSRKAAYFIQSGHFVINKDVVQTLCMPYALATMLHSQRFTAAHQSHCRNSFKATSPGMHDSSHAYMHQQVNRHMSTSHTGSTSLDVCADVCRWVRPIANYDNILQAAFTLWQISTTELWVDTMYKAIAAVGVDQQPRSGYNPVLALFFVAFIIFGGECFVRAVAEHQYIGVA